MIPAIPEGPSRSQTSTASASKVALDAVERRHLLARRSAVRTISAPSGHLVEVEGVQRLRGQQHHVVGDVDDVVDRPLPGGHQPRLQPQRRGPDLDVGEDAGGEARAELGDLDRDRGVVVGLALAGRLGVLLPRRRRQLGAGDRVDLAGDAVDAEAVDPVRVELELEHRLGDRQHLGERRCPACRAVAVARTTIPPASSPISSSASERIIPSDSTPRSFALPSFVPSGITAPGSATGTVWPAATLGAPQTIVRVPSPVSTSQTLRRSASGCCSAESTLPTTKPSVGRAAPSVGDPLDLDRRASRAARPAPRPRARGRSTRAARSTGTFIGTAPGRGRRSRRTCAGRGRRA